MLKTTNAEFLLIEILFTNQNNRHFELEESMNITLSIEFRQQCNMNRVIQCLVIYKKGLNIFIMHNGKKKALFLFTS